MFTRAQMPAQVRPPTTGRALDGSTRATMESRFHHDFGSVRVHAGPEAAAAAQALGAHAFTVGGRDIVVGANALSQSLLAHELAHVVQQRSAARLAPAISAPGDGHERDADRIAAGLAPVVPFAPPLVMRQATPRASYPTLEQYERLQQEIYNPVQSAGATLVDAAGFQSEMRTRLDTHIDNMRDVARLRQSSGIQLTQSDVNALGVVAAQQIETMFGRYLRVNPAMATAAAMQREVASRLHLVSERASDREEIACNWVVNIMESRGRDIIEAHHVVADSDAVKQRCSSTPGAAAAATTSGPAPAGQRDQALYQRVHDEVFTRRHDDLVLIAEFGPSFSQGDRGSWIQTHLLQRTGESRDDAIRRERWTALGTILHEVMHTVAHTRFRDAFQGVEETEVGVEGFAEYFARQAYDELRRRVADGDDALRLQIESVGSTFNPSLAEDRHGYQGYVDSVNSIRDILGGNEANLRTAYFEGRMEYLALGSWAQPGNQISFGAYLDVAGSGAAMLRVHYGRVVLGRRGRFQMHVGADVNYFTPGDRFGIAPDLTLQYSGTNVYVSAGLATGVSASIHQPIQQSIRLDLMPHFEAGVRINFFRIGASGIVLTPLAGGPLADRTPRVLGLLGASFDL